MAQAELPVRDGMWWQRLPWRDIAVATILGATAVLLVNMLGPTYRWDSDYILIHAEQAVHGNFDRLGSMAPLMPWALGLLRSLTGDMAAAVNIYLFLVWTGLFLLTRLVAPGLILTGVFVFAVCFANATGADQFAFVLTEPGFGVLLAAAVAALLPHFGTEPREVADTPARQAIFLSAIALLPLQRYIGGFPTVALAGVWLLTAGGTRQAAARLPGLILAGLPFAAVLFWNLLATGHLSGYRDPSDTTFAQNLALTAQVLGDDFPIETMLYLIVAAAGVAWAATRVRTRPVAAGVAVILLAVPALQLIVQAWASSSVAIDEIDTRAVIVVLPTVALLALWLLVDLLPSTRWPRVIFEPVFPLLALLLWLAGGWTDRPTEEPFFDRAGDATLSAWLAQPGLTRVALVADNHPHLFASDILTGRITSDLPCPRYTTHGSVLQPGFAFVPACDADAPVLAPLVFTGWQDVVDRFDAVVVRPEDDPSPLADRIRATAPDCAFRDVANEVETYDLRGCPVGGSD